MTAKQRFLDLAQTCRSALLEDVIPFWEKHSIDRECGGYFTCLDRDGSVFDTDKFVWLQARQVWTFSALYNRFEKHGEWFGYLNRAGEVLLPLKGGKWKGCFHLPRALYRCMREFELLAAR